MAKSKRRALSATAISSYPDNDDDAAWEDLDTPIQDGKLEPPSSTSSNPTASVRSPRKRRPNYKMKKSWAPSDLVGDDAVPSRQFEYQRIIMREEIVDGAIKGSRFTIKYIFDVFSVAIGLLRRPLSLIVSLCLLALIIGRVSHIIQGAFAPLCYLPGSSAFRFCRPSDNKGKLPQWADYPKLIDVQSATFEHLLDDSVGGSGLSLEIKKAQLATADLVTLVRISDLKSRDTLADTLVDFVNDAKSTGSGLQRLSSKVGGAVDSIMAVNDYALREIAAAQSKTTWSLNPWSKPQNTVTQTFTEAMSVLSTNMERLILEAEVNLGNLNKLEERLLTLHEIVSREDSSLSSSKAELLSELWTKLGGNQKALRNFDSHLMMLKNLGTYRKQALVHVVTALQTLQAMGSDMEDIRERVAAPELTGSKIPVEVHMKSIGTGLERLKEGRIRARRLEEEAMNRLLNTP